LELLTDGIATYFNGTKLNFDDVLDNIIQIYVIMDHLQEGMEEQDLDLADTDDAGSPPMSRMLQSSVKLAN
jgi:hypothetical protein